MLLLTAFIWGSAFVAQSVGMDYVGPFTFIALRFGLGALVVLPFGAFLNKKNPEQAAHYDKHATLKGGILCGLALFTASSSQQIGIMTTSAGKAGFITALYIVLVPLMGLFMKKKIGLNVWVSVVIASVGLYLLCIKENFTIAGGDFYLLLCALIFSIHILLISRFSSEADCIKMSGIQFLTCAVIALPLMFIFEKPVLADISAAWMPVLYAGLLSSGVAYTLQVVAMRSIKPEIASIILSLESVFAAVSGWLLLKEMMSPKEILGSALMFAAVILAQIPQIKTSERGN